jgi:hypothetical protein
MKQFLGSMHMCRDAEVKMVKDGSMDWRPISTKTSYRNLSHYTHSWSSALLERPPIVQPLKNFPGFYGIQRFITMFTRALHWSLL